MRIMFLIGICLLRLLPTACQTITISDEISLGNQKQFFILGKYDDDYLTFFESDESWGLWKFDQQMHEKNHRSIEPERRRTEVLAVMAGKQDFTVIYKFLYKGAMILKANKYNPNGELTDSLTIHNYGVSLTHPKLTIVNSEDQQQIVVWSRQRDSLYQAIRFDIPQMTALPSLIINTPEPEFEAYFEFLIDNQANTYLVSEQHPYNSEREQHHFIISRFGSDGTEQKTLLDMQEKLTHQAKFVCDNTNKCLTGVGLYADQNPAYAKGCFYTRLIPDVSTPEIHFNAFDPTFAASIATKKNIEKGITDLIISQVMLRRDGGVILLLEQHREVTSTVSGSRFDAHTLHLDYYYDNVAAMSIHPNGASHFQSAMFKKQYSYDDDGFYSSFFLQRTPSQARLIFNDEIRSETTVSEYILDGEGETKRRTLFSTEQYDVFLSFRNALQTSATEIIVPSIYRSRLRLVKISS